MNGRGLLLVAGIAAVSPVSAERAVSSDFPQIGACAIFREGGAGFVVTTPIYWLRGSISGIRHERRLAGVCPRAGKAPGAYTRDDWARAAAAAPCVEKAAEAREVDVVRVTLVADAWETPWSHQHGSSGWLFRGHFLNTALKKGGGVEMDASWLARCEAQP